MRTGIGVGFSLAAWGSAAVAELPGGRFARPLAHAEAALEA
jgi:hypothetical protein